ncbi:sugar phosphate isomerase/epimerase family protein [Tengunoibacter tsumagoiensis]|uniref:Xylose isomerase n=1 Tax=Tengunoibacter tsumagoiensis TaxID=2014871 RepID=A0A402A7Q5_9CHLR|nr:sugar phosphate isomerase/epimerase family protein [Tengunoibacter tsumagoiensis]GCE15182.1 xylose isomerase [Tengunoibacter tsumagoiensis]
MTPAWPRLGVFSYDYPDVESLIAACHHSGLTTVQLANTLLDDCLAHPEHSATLRATLEAQGISIVGLAAYRNLVAPDQAKRRSSIDYIKRCLQVAPLLGTPVVATETGTLHAENDWIASPENQSAAAWETLYQTLNELVPVAQQHGSILALEGFVNNVIGSYDRMEIMLERIASPHLQMVLDPYNYLTHAMLPESTQRAEEFFQRFEDRFVIAHLKDVSAEGAEVDTPEFGLGVFPQEPYIDFLRTRRPDLPLILEHLPGEHIPAAVTRLQAIIASLA